MHKVIPVFLVFMLSGTLWAADPIIDTWVLNVSESQLPHFFASLESQKDSYEELSSGHVKGTLIRKYSDGSTVVSSGIWPSQGGVVKDDSSDSAVNSAEGELLVETLIAPGEWYVTRIKDGKQYGLMHKVVGKDGKTYRLRLMDVNDKGMLVEIGVLVFDRK